MISEFHIATAEDLSNDQIPFRNDEDGLVKELYACFLIFGHSEGIKDETV